MFLARVTELIKSRGITRNKLLLETGINTNAFQNWEKRGNIPSGDVVAKIADYFHVSTDYLLGRTDDPHPVGEETRPTPAPEGLTAGEMQVALAYRAADERTRKMVDLALEPWKKPVEFDRAM